MNIEINHEQVLTKEWLTEKLRKQYSDQSTPEPIRKFIEPFLLYGFDFASEFEGIDPFFPLFANRKAGALTVYKEGEIESFDFVVPLLYTSMLGVNAKKKEKHDWVCKTVKITEKSRIDKITSIDSLIGSDPKIVYIVVGPTTEEALFKTLNGNRTNGNIQF